METRSIATLLLGAAGRDFHVFNTVYRDDAGFRVVAFTATQIPGIAQRRYPASLAGARYPDGIPIEDDVADSLPRAQPRLARWPSSAKIFLKPDGRALGHG